MDMGYVQFRHSLCPLSCIGYGQRALCESRTPLQDRESFQGQKTSSTSQSTNLSKHVKGVTSI